MNNKPNLPTDFPKTIISKNLFDVDVSSDPIILPITNGNRYIRIWELKEEFGQVIFEKIFRYFLFLIERYSSQTAIAFLQGLKILLPLLKGRTDASIGDRVLHEFRLSFNDKKCKRPARKIRSWLLWDIEVSPSPILSHIQAQIITDWKFKDVAAYAAIRRGDDGVGPLSRRDDITLSNALRRPIDETRKLCQLDDCQMRTIIMIMRRLGLRPTQISYLKLEDFQVWKHAGKKAGVLYIPIIKNGEVPRAEFNKRRLSPELIDKIEESVAHRPNFAGGGWLFCRRTKNRALPTGAPPDEYWRVRSIDQSVQSWVKKNDLKSTDNNPLRVTPRNLRYTFATELAPRLSPLLLSNALGHKDQRSIMHYYTYSDGFHARLSSIDGATKWGISAATFIGEISDNRNFENDGGAILFGSQQNFDDTPILNIGRCGARTQCRLYPPLSCYGCSRFRPDPDADHLAALRALVAWREVLPEQGGRLKDPLRGQLDDVIEAAGNLVGILPAYHWVREMRENLASCPTNAEIADATKIAVDTITNDRSIQAMLRSWPLVKSGARRVSKRRASRG